MCALLTTGQEVDREYEKDRYDAAHQPIQQFLGFSRYLFLLIKIKPQIQPKMTTRQKNKENWSPRGSTTDAGCVNADSLKASLSQATGKDYRAVLRDLQAIGRTLRSDQDQPKLIDKPIWFDHIRFKQARRIYRDHFMGVNFAHLSGLLLLVRVDSIYRTLSKTGESDSVAKLFKRYFNTIKHVKRWYEGDIFEEGSDAHRSFLIVRGMHNKVCSKLNKSPKTGSTGDQSTELMESQELQWHISEYDIMITQFAFMGFIVLKPQYVGLLDKFTQEDLENMLYFWRVIGHYLGASERFNLFSYELRDILGICEAIMELEYKQSIAMSKLDQPPGIMSLNIIRSIKFIPMLTIYAMIRYLYEIVEEDPSEVEHKQNWYSRLSYTLMKLVMTRLLKYAPLRSFNNGLTRLSVFLVGKVEGWFAGRLESQYGNSLKV